MPRYLVRPKASLASRGLNLAGLRLHPSARGGQLRARAEQHRSDPFYDEIRRWVAQAPGEAVRPLTGLEAEATPVTGTKVLHMTEEHAQRLRDEVEGVEVIVERVMELIRPEKVTASTKEVLDEGDPWHLAAVGLGGARKGGHGVTVLVLDTGVDAAHPEITGRVSAAYTFDVDAWTAAPQEPGADTEGHGTHVSGLIAGRTVGIAPEATLVSGVMIPGGKGKTSDFVLAMEWAGSQPEIQVVNMSAGLPGYLPEMSTAVSGLLAVGVLPVVAVGNEGRNRTRSPGNYVEVVSVGASTRDKQVASFSGGGTVSADGHQYVVPNLVAPGAEIYSCVREGGYQAMSGTSMATPIVAGLAALLLERHPHIAVTDLYEELLMSCEDLGLPADRQGDGLIRVRPA
jgi:subtilisin family serine protease